MKKNLLIKLIVLSILSVSLIGCDTLWDKDNTPIPTPLCNFKSEIHPTLLWSSYPNYGAYNEIIRLRPAVTCHRIYTASREGNVSAVYRNNGKLAWKFNVGFEITSGPAANDGIVVVGGHDGDIVALDQNTGCVIWRNKISSEVLAAPAIGRGRVIVKSIDGHVSAFYSCNGQPAWSYDQTEPTLILRGASAPVIEGNSVFVGFASGNLIKFNLSDGDVLWKQSLGTPYGSFPIQHMVDLDADPYIFSHRLYAATYQGRIGSINLSTGEIQWSHDISTYTGITADNHNVYITDAIGDVWAFNAESGNVVWRQTQLEHRNITGPAMAGNYIAVGDAQGYLHWLCKQDGHFVARIKVNGNSIIASPVESLGTLYVVTQGGVLNAYHYC